MKDPQQLSTGSDHSRFALWLSLDLDGRLAAAEQVQLADHLEQCAGCRRSARELRFLREALRVEVPQPASVGLKDRILARLEHERPGREEPAAGVIPLLRRSTAAAAVLLLVLGVVQVVRLPSQARAEDPQAPPPAGERFEPGPRFRAVMKDRPEHLDGNTRYLDFLVPGDR